VLPLTDSQDRCNRQPLIRGGARVQFWQVLAQQADLADLFRVTLRAPFLDDSQLLRQLLAEDGEAPGVHLLVVARGSDFRLAVDWARAIAEMLARIVPTSRIVWTVEGGGQRLGVEVSLVGMRRSDGQATKVPGEVWPLAAHPR